MNPRILPSHKVIFTVFFFFFWILCLVVGSPVLAATIGSGDCQPQRCGNHTIKYPFWLSNKQPSYCGVSPFNVTCISSGGQAETLSLNVFDGLYHVKNIFYENKSVQLNAAGFDDDRCPLPTFNITSGLYPFDLSSANKRIFFLSNCSSPMNLSAFQNISCAADGGLAYFGGEYNGSGKLNFSGGVCKLFVVPVVGYIDVGIDVNYSALLRTGWLLNWTAPDCTVCSDSGGQCGFNDTTSKFMCICPDRVHLRKCG
uniref:Wall-associated receptor kinase galacturonan-binding domain-containing protein n=1 Tax=Musa acuminata subsp. malaccensis TaxID=214687 RepID=A0A804HUW1_MUSAM|nr:PREDICTED: LEAF RUST 10 DISEASE-RESISTANCE LOCUS RECEPTOR-LIKE PROTEIN KINASE-like 1.2 [Musa acuminata subsp. malaccensis]